MITGRDIIYISSIEWSFLWQTHQEIALRLAAQGNRVLYIENTGVRAPGLRDARRVAGRLGRWLRASSAKGAREASPNIYVCSPMVLPPFGTRWRRELNRRLFIPRLLNVARRLGMRRALVWTYLPNDTTLDLIHALRKDMSGLVYYCGADFSQLSPHAQKLLACESEIVDKSDVVFTNCSELARKFRPLNANTHVFPPGVNLDAFPLEGKGEAFEAKDEDGEEASKSKTSETSELSRLKRPLIGYVGGLHRHFDYGLLREMALRRPNWSWICVGARQAATSELEGLPNVHLTGQRPHAELYKYIREFDVCIAPYVQSVYTATVVPTKINEYLAVGKPVVSTALPPVCEFNEEHKVLLTAEADPEAFLRAIEEALSLPKDVDTIMRRRRTAELADWKTRYAQMCELVELSLEARRLEPSSAKAAKAV